MSDITDDVLAIIKRHSQVDRAKLELDDKLQDLGIESIDAVTILSRREI
jgi:acyl carrier protein